MSDQHINKKYICSEKILCTLCNNWKCEYNENTLKDKISELVLENDKLRELYSVAKESEIMLRCDISKIRELNKYYIEDEKRTRQLYDYEKLNSELLRSDIKKIKEIADIFIYYAKSVFRSKKINISHVYGFRRLKKIISN